jgi:cation diffusion facilitator CzcD-associated flavoprotein CzcO
MTTSDQELDALIVGAGFSGMYAMVRFREQGLRVRVIEAASDVGGTWYWNRYPGARCDVPSVEYSYSFSKELEQDWDWSEVMAGQPEILRYANHVADRFDLRRDIQFDTRVASAQFDDEDRRWRVTTEGGEVFVTRFCIMATGCLSEPNTPPIEGAADFAGAVYHTGRWPHEGVDFTDVHVGIIGTGSSGVQAIPVIARMAKHLTVFQRTPNYTLPAGNRPLSDEDRRRTKAVYERIRQSERESMGGFVFGFGGNPIVVPTDAILETTAEQRDTQVDSEGFGAIARYLDVQLDLDANELACEMYRQQVSRVVNDPETATGLMPRGYPIGCKRPVIDTDYFDTFNRENVTLVDLRIGAIERITPVGVRTEQGQFDVDALVYATGFDAMTGAVLSIDVRGRGGVALRDTWSAGPCAYLGLQVNGFPNLFTVTGPGSPSVLSNMIVSIEQHIDWIGDCIAYMDRNDLATIEPEIDAQDAWIAHVNEVAEGTMLTAPTCNSWYLGANIPGKPRIFMPYVGGVGEYRKKCDEVVANDYEGFSFE